MAGHPAGDIEGANAVKPVRVALRGRVAASLLGQGMDDHAMVDAPGGLQRLHQLRHIVAVYRAEIGDAKMREACAEAGDRRFSLRLGSGAQRA